jgi:ribonuclease HII
MLILGIDDAGRGPIIGPMIMAGVLIDNNQEAILKKQKITDSKLLNHKQRINFSKIIVKNSKAQKIITTHPKEIDHTLNDPDTNLNKLEAQKSAEIINSLNKGKTRITVIIDCPSTNIPAWRNTVLKYVTTKSNLTVKCEHKADFRHKSVAAASILAKVEREKEVAKLKKEFGDFGSGYPSDPTTKQFLKEKGRELANSGIFRKSWSTWKKLYPDKSQSSLTDF